MVLENGWPMYAKTIDGVWFDVGHPSELIRAQHTLIEQRASLPFPLPEGDFSGNSFIASSAKMNGEIEGTVVSSLSQIENGSVLKDVLVMSGSKVGKDCRLTNSVIGEQVEIGAGCSLENVIVGDGVILEPGRVLNDCRIPSQE